MCFLWFGLGNLFVLSRQFGGFLYRTTACSTDQSFYIFPLILLVPADGRKNPTLGIDAQRSPTNVFLVSRYVRAFEAGILRCSGA